MRYNTFSTRFHSERSFDRHRGFTLVQILIVIGLISILSALLVGQFGRSRGAVRRAECDVHLKEIVLAMDTFRQETGHLPEKLIDLKTQGYLPAIDTFRCSADPELATNGNNAGYSSYSDFYVLRDAGDDRELPVIVCPFHEKDGQHGAQGFKGGYTKTFGTRPAVLSGIEGVVTVKRPGEGVLEIPASGQLDVRGGDRITLGAGKATLTFADASVATLSDGSEMRVLESYLESQDRDSIYTLVRQLAGTISYSVIPGNKFDVATPTATAGALGTEFSITIVAPSNPTSSGAAALPETLLKVTKHAVAFTAEGRTIEVDETDTAGVRSDDPNNDLRPRAVRDAKEKKIKKGKNTDQDKQKQDKEEKEEKDKRDKKDKKDKD